jgi:hypothetical protein
MRFAKSVPLRTTSELAISRCPVGPDILAGCRRNGSASLFTGIEIQRLVGAAERFLATPIEQSAPIVPKFFGALSKGISPISD